MAPPVAPFGLHALWRPSRTFSFVVSRPKLREVHAAPFADRALQTHCRVLLSDDPTVGVRRRGAVRLFAQVPPHKRLGALGPGLGLPIGNLTGQFFVNVYLNELDQFVKHQLKARWCVRYVYDFVLLHADPARLPEWREKIEDFLATRLSLKPKALAEPHALQQGTDFLGYVIRPFYRLARRRVVKRLQTCLCGYARACVRANALELPAQALPLLRQRLQSKGLAYQVVSQTGHFKTGFKQCTLTAVWHPQPLRFYAVHPGTVIFERLSNDPSEPTPTHARIVLSVPVCFWPCAAAGSGPARLGRPYGQWRRHRYRQHHQPGVGPVPLWKNGCCLRRRLRIAGQLGGRAGRRCGGQCDQLQRLY